MSDWKKSFIESEQEKSDVSLPSSGWEPMRKRVCLYVTVCLFITGTILVVSAGIGIFLLGGGWVVVGGGGLVGVEVIIAASVVTWLARGLANTAMVQGYLVVGALAFISCLFQTSLLAILTTLSHHNPKHLPPFATDHESLRAWLQFLGGAQGAMAVLVGGILGASMAVTSCCYRAPQDNVVGVYHPR